MATQVAPSRPRTTLVGWLAGTAAILAVGLVTTLAFANALANIAHEARLPLLDRLGLSDPALGGHAIDTLIEHANDRRKVAELETLARGAVRRQAINPKAVQTLGLIKEINGDTASAERLMQIAHRLSRRELVTEVWLIEAMVRKNDVDGALAHYDIALRASSDAAPLLYPVLASAISDPALRRAVTKYVREDAPWMNDFLRYVAQSTNNPQDAAEVVMEARNASADQINPSLETLLFARLAEANQFAVMRRLYLADASRPRSTLETIDLSDQNIDPRFGPVTWLLNDTGMISAAFQKDGGDRNRLTASAMTSDRGILASKALFLRPGAYTLSISVAASRQSGRPAASWTLYCLNGAGRFPLARVHQDVGLSPRDLGGQVTVGANCPAQMLTLTVTAGEAEQGVDFEINNFRLGAASS